MNVETDTVPVDQQPIEYPGYSEETLTEPAGASRLNLISMLLASVGIFVAGTLSIGHAMAKSVPCGENGGCETIAQHPSSLIFGVPVAYLGLAAYLAIAGISVLRALSGVSATRKMGYVALALSGLGALFSFYLQYIALTKIKAFCPWCLASAITMCLLFLAQAWLAQIELPDHARPSSRPVGFATAMAFLAFLGVGYQATVMTRQPAPVKMGFPKTEEEMLTKDSMREGPDSAPIKIVEFSDLLCGSCRAMYPKIMEYMGKSNGKVQLIFRHYPIYRMHPMALPGAFVVEYAREKDKGWDFVRAMYKTDAEELKTVDDVLRVAQSVGLNPDDIKKRMKDSDPAYQRVTRDIKAAKDHGINMTPTFVVMAPGVQPTAFTGPDLIHQLNQPQYKQFVDAK